MTSRELGGRPTESGRGDVRHLLVLLAILAVAVALRFWQLDTLPPGLYRDEATNGLDALRVLKGEHPLYFTANNGREPLYIYLLAASIGLLGRTPGALRVVSALLGSATVLCSYWLGRELYGKRAGLLLAALVATSVWCVNLSRIAFRAVALPLFSAAMLAAMWHGLRQRRWPWMVLAGLLWGASFYTYLAARFTLLALPALIAYLCWLRPEWRWWRGWALMAVVALVVAAPLGCYVVSHWAETMGRAGQVSILNPAISNGHPWRALTANTWYTLLAPFVRGDFIPRHNIPLRPALGWVMAPLGLVGAVLLLLRAWREAAAGLVLIWCLTMALPTVLAENAPHFVRGAGVLPVLYLLPVVGLEWGADWLRRVRPSLAVPALIALVIASGAVEMQAYARHLHSEAVYYNFEGGATELAARINRYVGVGWTGTGLAVGETQAEPARTLALDARLPENWTALTFLVPESEQIVDLERIASLDPPCAVAAWAYADLPALVSALPEGGTLDVRAGALERGDLEAEARQLYTWIEVDGLESPEHVLDARWEGGLTLKGYTLRRGEEEIDVTLWWQADEPVSTDYTVFCQAVVDEQLVGQLDGSPALGLASTSRWPRYDVIIDRRTVSVDNDHVAAAALYVGLYDPSSMVRLPMLAPGGEPADEDYAILE